MLDPVQCLNVNGGPVAKDMKNALEDSEGCQVSPPEGGYLYQGSEWSLVYVNMEANRTFPGQEDMRSLALGSPRGLIGAQKHTHRWLDVPDVLRACRASVSRPTRDESGLQIGNKLITDYFMNSYHRPRRYRCKEYQ